MYIYTQNTHEYAFEEGDVRYTYK